MGDLISRSALKEHLISYAGMLTNDGFMVNFQAVLNGIDCQPTACDLDAVVEKLEEEVEWAKTHGTDEMFRQGRVSGLLTAIRIMKGGAV